MDKMGHSFRLATGGKLSIRGQRTEVRGQRTEVRGQRSEDSGEREHLVGFLIFDF
jgi:hypothetical protein